MKQFVGNGVVHLGHSENKERATDDMLLEEYFTRAEKEVIFSSADYHENAWILWSCKTTAFKIARKLDHKFPFDPKSMQVIPFGGAYSESEHKINARVSTGVGPVFTETTVAGEVLTTIGATDIKALQNMTHKSSLLATDEDMAEQVRTYMLAHLSEKLQIEAAALSIKKDSAGIPCLFNAGKLCDVDLSLSHNYGLIAFAYLDSN